MTVEEFVGQQPKIKRATIFGRRGVRACCPAHDDEMPSFYAWEGEDGWIHVKCPKCTEEALLAALQRSNDERRMDDRATPEPFPDPVLYTYHDAGGAPLIRKKRYYKRSEKSGRPEKTFALEHFDPAAKSWVSGLGKMSGKVEILYRLPEVKKAIEEGRTIYVNEGEKACDKLHEKGLVGTCQPFGADENPKGKWKSAHTALLKGAKLVRIVADRDAVGEEYARYVAAQLAGVVGRVEVVQSMTTGSKDDAYDHLAKGYGEDHWVCRPDLMPRRGLLLKRIDEFDIVDPEYLFGRHIRKAQINLLDADGGTGKTRLAMAFAAAGSNGFDPLTNARFEPFKTLYFGEEDEGGELHAVYKEVQGRSGYLYVYNQPFVLNDQGLRELKETILDGRFALVVFDALMYYLQGLIKDSSDMMAAAKVCGQLRDVALSTRAGILNLRHTAKGVMGKQASDLGIGSVQFRNSHRSQLVMRFHPDVASYRGLRIVTHEKGSIRTQQGDPFGFRIDGSGTAFVLDVDNPFESSDTRMATGRRPAQKDKARELLEHLFSNGRIYTHEEIVESGREAGISYDTLNRVRPQLGIQTGKLAGFSDNRYRWYKPEERDPFLDDD